MSTNENWYRCVNCDRLMLDQRRNLHVALNCVDCDMLSGDCNLNHILFYDSGAETRMPNCILRHAVFYFRDKAQKDLDLDIRRLEQEANNVFQLHTAPDMTEIGRGDQDSMRCLKNKIKLLESILPNII